MRKPVHFTKNQNDGTFISPFPLNGNGARNSAVKLCVFYCVFWWSRLNAVIAEFVNGEQFSHVFSSNARSFFLLSFSNWPSSSLFRSIIRWMSLFDCLPCCCREASNLLNQWPYYFASTVFSVFFYSKCFLAMDQRIEIFVQLANFQLNITNNRSTT